MIIIYNLCVEYFVYTGRLKANTKLKLPILAFFNKGVWEHCSPGDFGSSLVFKLIHVYFKQISHFLPSQ